MRKLLKKHIYSFLCTALLLGIFLFGYVVEKESLAAASSDIYFYISSAVGDQRISIYASEGGKNYVFLPSYIEMADVKVGLPLHTNATLDGISLNNAMSCESFELGKEYTLSQNGKNDEKLYFMKSANVATMYIDTLSGNMDHIHKDKEHEELTEIRLFTEAGQLDFYSEGCTIKGRGNATWQYEKKPYVITLQHNADLLGMGSATKWVLLANATDESNLHNKLVFDYAQSTVAGWVPQCEYVDVYLNGAYNGLYLLCEKVEVNDSRLDLDTNAGDFLCRVELNNRWEILKTPILTAQGRTVEISEPDVLGNDVEKIKASINALEEVILSGDDLSQNNTFDEQSWIARYLIDEIFGNIDADLCSSYFYKKDGVFYAGPIWDYDLVFGNSPRNENTQAFVAKNLHKTVHGTSDYYHALYQNKSFYAQLTEAYQSQFLPALQHLMDFKIDELNSRITEASKLNSIRWSEMYAFIFEYGSVYKTTADTIRTYLEERIQFLNSV